MKFIHHRILALAALLFIVATLAVARPARAQSVDAAPFAGHCFGASNICLVPELTFDVSRVALNGPDAGKLSAGAIPLGAGYSLLFGYDQWWASGPAFHAILDYQASGTSMIQASGMLTAARYFHAGFVYQRLGGEDLWFVAGGLTMPVDLVTGAIAEKKMKAARAGKLTAGDF